MRNLLYVLIVIVVFVLVALVCALLHLSLSNGFVLFGIFIIALAIAAVIIIPIEAKIRKNHAQGEPKEEEVGSSNAVVVSMLLTIMSGKATNAYYLSLSKMTREEKLGCLPSILDVKNTSLWDELAPFYGTEEGINVLMTVKKYPKKLHILSVLDKASMKDLDETTRDFINKESWLIGEEKDA